MVGILLLFLVVNLLLVLGLFLVSNSGGTQKQQFQISALSEHIKEQNGKIIADGEALSMLKERMAWAMLLDEGGCVIWEEGMPAELPRSYSVSEVAAFSRWYLRDYFAEGAFVSGSGAFKAGVSADRAKDFSECSLREFGDGGGMQRRHCFSSHSKGALSFGKAI